MNSAWENAGTLPVRPPDDLGDRDVVVTDHGTYWECGATDWHLMLGWFAGPETLMRLRDDRQHWSTVVVVDGAGNRQISRQLVAEEELAELDEEVNQLLEARGLPARPSGFRWFQLVPPGGTGHDVVAAFFRMQSEMPERFDVVQETAHARAAIERLYGRPVTTPPPFPPEAWGPEPLDERTAASRRAEDARAAELLPGPTGAVPILQCRNLPRSLAFYAELGFDAEELAGYAILRDGSTELHLSRTGSATTGGCLIRVPDAAGLWRRLAERVTPGPLEEDNPGMLRFTLFDPDHNQLIVVSSR